MRCLQCGREVPLLKRLSGGEFCSDAHRRDYQHEYSQLALARLKQTSRHSDDEKLASPPPPLFTPAMVVTTPQNAGDIQPTQAKSITLPGASSAGVAPVIPAPRPAPVAPTPAARNAEVEKTPPLGNVVTQQPSAFKPEFEIMVSAERETFIVATVPQVPRHAPGLSPVELLRAHNAPWERTLERKDSRPHVSEARLEPRAFVRPTPVVDLDLRIGGTRRWNIAQQSAEFAALSGLAPAAPGVWFAALRDFAVQMNALSEILDQPLPLLASQNADAAASRDLLSLAPALPADPAVVSQTAPASSDLPRSDPPRSDLPHENAPPKLVPPVSMPSEWRGTPAGRAKPMQVFQSWLPDPRTAETATPETLPLRPVMILVPLSNAKPASEPAVSLNATLAKARKADVRILPPEKTLSENEKGEMPLTVTAPIAAIRAPEPVVVSPLQSVKRDDLGLPEFRMQPSGAEIAARIWTKVAGLRGRK